MEPGARAPQNLEDIGPRHDIARLTASLDLVVVPTAMDFEGVPLSVIEAQAAANDP